MRGPALPSWVMRRRLVVEERHEGQCRIFTLHPPTKYTAGLHILYLHGGAFTFAITAPQWRFIVRVIRRLGCSVTVPLYPLAPEHTCPEVFEFLLPLASELLRENRRTVFMGDSAGGGIALALCQQLRAAELSLPARVALISPALDLTFSDRRQPEIARVDPLLDIPGSRAAGAWYAGELPLTDPRVSPLFGELDGLPPIAVWTGTHDLLYPDAVRLKNKAQEARASVSLFEYDRLFHVWPLLRLPEGKTALEQIATFVQEP
jgi:acetyl esterase/lipase